MKYLLIAFLVSAGWRLGKIIVDIIMDIIVKLINLALKKFGKNLTIIKNPKGGVPAAQWGKSEQKAKPKMKIGF